MNINTVGVTGTRGKTTTTYLIKNIINKYLEINNKKNNENKKAYLAGNIQGIASLELLEKLKYGDHVVFELDSWILQGFKDIKYSPHISVFTTFMPDHMNYYKNNMQDYFLDKANIFINQKEADILITTDNIVEDSKKYLHTDVYKKIFELRKNNFILNTKKIEEYRSNYNFKLIGKHNDINTALAIVTGEKLNIQKNIIQEAINNFSGAPGRLELIKKLNNIEIINDTTATTGDAMMAALETFRENNIILICGGRDKELSMSNAAKKIIDFYNQKIISKIILLDDINTNKTTTGTEKLKNILKENNFENYLSCETLERCVSESKTYTQVLSSDTENKTTILFSPGFASFGVFLNEYDRGEKFTELINKYFY